VPGHLPAGECLDRQLAAQLAAQPGTLQRQLCILNWIFGQFHHSLAPSRIIRYENVVSTSSMALSEATQVPIPQQPLNNRNASRLYDVNLSEHHADALIRNDGVWRKFYSNQDITNALDALREGQ